MFRVLVYLLLVLVVRAEAGGRWVLVVAPELREAFEPLAAQRRADGWAVSVLPADDGIGALRGRIAELAVTDGPLCVVLGGDFREEAGGFRVPAGRGTQLRMAGKLSDAPWNVVDGSPERVVEAGRVPARDADEAAAMVAKILSWPDRAAAGGPFPSAAMVAGHHGAPAAFAGIADGLTNSLARRLVSRLPAAWRFQAAVHIDGSPWQTSGSDLPGIAREMATGNATLLAYMGHSSPDSPVSRGRTFFGAGDWRSLRAAAGGPGLFFSCGCYTTELDGAVESFGFAAIRSPGGPAAVIGSHGETYAAFGYLAMCGLVNRLAEDPESPRLGELWHAVREGIAKQEIASAEFAMLDMSDGTGGRVPLAEQRLEHLESWMLLGDPAMPLLSRAPGIRLSVTGSPTGGAEVAVEGQMPDGLPKPTAVRVTFERQPGTPRADLPQVPAGGDERIAATRKRRALSGDVVLAADDAPVSGGRFRVVLRLPNDLPPPPWTVRAREIDGGVGGAIAVSP